MTKSEMPLTFISDIDHLTFSVMFGYTAKTPYDSILPLIETDLTNKKKVMITDEN